MWGKVQIYEANKIYEQKIRISINVKKSTTFFNKYDFERYN